KSGPLFASSNVFKITIRGKGTHAAMPHGGIDLIVVACRMVQALHSIVTRNKRPIDAALLSVTTLHAGTAVNVVPDVCELGGTVRAFCEDVRGILEQRKREVGLGTCTAFGAAYDFEFRRHYPPTINQSRKTEFARRVLESHVGPAKVQDFEPTMT